MLVMENGSVAVHRARPGLFPDLSLLQNLLLENSLVGNTAIDEATLREVGRLFACCGWHLNLSLFESTWPEDALPNQLLMVWLGRSILSAPVHLLILESDWPDDCDVTIEQFKNAYQWSYPWRCLTLVTTDNAAVVDANP